MYFIDHSDLRQGVFGVNRFEEVALRLKQEVGVTLDREVAELIGLTPRAWAGRKKADSFPEESLYALTAKRPDLKIDVSYVLTGQRLPAGVSQPLQAAVHAVGQQPEMASAITQSIAATAQKERLNQQTIESLRTLLHWCSEADQDLLLAIARRLARS